MDKLFSLNSKPMLFLTFIADLILINLLWLVSCIPIFTIGVATAAVYECILKRRRDGILNVFRDFFASFRENFKKATILFLIIIAAILFLIADIFILSQLHLLNSIIGSIYLLVLIIIIVPALGYIYPLQAQFENSVLQTLKNAWIIAIMHLPTSLLIIGLNLLPILLVIVSPELFIKCSLLFVILGFSGTAYLISALSNHIFIKHKMLN